MAEVFLWDRTRPDSRQRAGPSNLRIHRAEVVVPEVAMARNVTCFVDPQALPRDVEDPSVACSGHSLPVDTPFPRAGILSVTPAVEIVIGHTRVGRPEIN